MKRAAKRALLRLGVDVRRASASTAARRRRILDVHGIDVVLDVGANVGQYGRLLRDSGYRGRIVSFEPQREQFERLREAAAGDPAWECRHLALGERDGEAVIHVGGHSETSSFLPVLEELHEVDAWRPAGSESVAMSRLDSVAGEVIRDGERPYLKLDVQGYELAVLEGARATLGRVRALESELAVVPQYAGQPSYREVIDALDAEGFELAYVDPGYFHWESGHLVYVDGFFVRKREG